MAGTAEQKIATFVLLGKTGNGKSSTGNTIVGREAFEDSDSELSHTLDVIYAYGRFNERKLKVVDTPGFCENRMSRAKALEKLVKDMSRVVFSCPDGIDAMLIVIRYGSRFTEEDLNTVRGLKAIFGEKFLEDFGVVVFTFGEDFDLKHRKKQGQYTFGNWVNEQKGELKNILQECQMRYVVFRNQLDEKRNESLTNLLAHVDSLMARGVTYTEDLFCQAKAERDKFFAKEKADQLKDEMSRDIDMLQDRLMRIVLALRDCDDNSDTLKSDLDNLMADTNLLEANIKHEDRQSGVLSELLMCTEKVKTTIEKLRNDLQDKKLEMERENTIISFEENQQQLQLIQAQHSERNDPDYEKAVAAVGGFFLRACSLLFEMYTQPTDDPMNAFITLMESDDSDGSDGKDDSDEGN